VDSKPFDARDYHLDLLSNQEVIATLEPIFIGGPVPDGMEQQLTHYLRIGSSYTKEDEITTAWIMVGLAWCCHQQTVAAMATMFARSALTLIKQFELSLPQAASLANALIEHYIALYPEIRSSVPEDRTVAAMEQAAHRVRKAIISIGE